MLVRVSEGQAEESGILFYPESPDPVGRKKEEEEG